MRVWIDILLVISLFAPQRPAPPTFGPPPQPPTQVHSDKEPKPKDLKAVQGKTAATLRWTDGNTPPSDTFNIWRVEGDCGQYPILAKIKTGVKGASYIDSTIKPNRTYCYAVSSVYKGEESAQCTPVTAIPPKGK